jgi:hypothetical protein
MAYPLSPIKADGSKRYRPDVVAKPLPKKQRSRRTNGKLIDGRSASVRRVRDLTLAFSIGIDMNDEEARGAVVSTARLTVAAEDLGDKIDRGEGDSCAYATLVNARDRGLARLRELRTQAGQQAGNVVTSGAGWSQPLYRHLFRMRWLSWRAGESAHGKVPTQKDRPELYEEFDRREAAGEFRNVAR